MRLSFFASAFASLLVVGTAGEALASSGIDSPENGAEQVGRGSAWLARAETPLAAYYNPAALVRQSNGVELGVHLMFMNQCFSRLGPDGKPVSPGNGIPGPGAPGGPDAAVCTDNGAFPNPQLAANFKLGKDLAIGVALVGPHGTGAIRWPESIDYTNKFGVQTTQPSPQRYLLVSADSLIINPTISVSWAPTDRISLGAGFIWGIANVEFVNFAETVSPAAPPGTTPGDDFDKHQDVQATLKAKDLFVPGFVLSGLWSATDRFDVAGWFKWQDAIRAKTDLQIQSHYWTKAGANDKLDKANLTDEKEAGTIKFSIPMEARIGFRYHHPRENPAKRPQWASAPGVRDPMSDDLFDLEMDFTWANNSAVDNLELRFHPGILVKGTPGYVPVNGDIPHQWRDVVGVRLGGEVVPLPGRLALRAGGFFESKGQDDKYLGLDFNLAQRVGIGGGATVRLGPVDVALAYQHTFYGTLDNGGKGAIHALSGDASTGDYRSKQIVNGGKLTASMNEVALSGVLHW